MYKSKKAKNFNGFCNLIKLIKQSFFSSIAPCPFTDWFYLSPFLNAVHVGAINTLPQPQVHTQPFKHSTSGISQF